MENVIYLEKTMTEIIGLFPSLSKEELMTLVRKATYEECKRKFIAKHHTEWGGEDGRVPMNSARLIAYPIKEGICEFPAEIKL